MIGSSSADIGLRAAPSVTASDAIRLAGSEGT